MVFGEESLAQREIVCLPNQSDAMPPATALRARADWVQRCLLPLLFLIATRLAHQPHRRADASERELCYASSRSVPGEAEA